MKKSIYFPTILLALLLFIGAGSTVMSQSGKNTQQSSQITLSELKSDVSYITSGQSLEQVMATFKARFATFHAQGTDQQEWQTKKPGMYAQMMKENVLIRKQFDPNWENIKDKLQKYLK